MTDAVVTFAVVDGGGSLEPGVSITGADGAYGTHGNSSMKIPAEGGEPTPMTSGDRPSWRP